jgi:hypothetical protein
MPVFHQSADLDTVGAGLPVHALEPLAVPGGAMGALRRSDEDAFAAVLLQLGHVGWAALDWGEGDCDGLAGWSRILAEGAALWPLCEPGRVQTSDGRVLHGVAPSGAKRGDRFICAHDERLHDKAFGTLRGLHEKLASFGFALGARMNTICLTGCGDTLFACFPGGGAQYGAHYDGGPGDARRLTMILYPNEEWRDEEDGGALMLFDATSRCWRAVAPRAGRLVVFRSDKVLHKVAPAHRERWALTLFMAGEDKRKAPDP